MRLPEPQPGQQTAAQRAYAALERLLERTLRKEFTGNASLELDVKQGGITTVRLGTRELV